MPVSDRAVAPTWTAHRVRASGTSILLAIVAVVAVIVVRGVFEAATQPIGWAVAAATVALVVTPIVEVVARRIPRGLAILATLVLGVALVVTVGIGTVIEVQAQLSELAEQLPAAAAEVEEASGPDGVASQLGLAALVQDLVDQMTERVSPTPTIDDAAGTVPAFLVSGVLVIFFLIWGRQMFDGLVRQISDDDRQERVTSVTVEAVGLAERYLLGAIALAITVALAGSGLALVFDLPTPLVLGVVLGASSVVPYVGVLFGGVPMVLLAGATESLGVTLALIVLLVVVQALTTVASRRLIEARSLRVGPAIIVIAALIGSDVYGIGGALVALVAGVMAMAVIEAIEGSP